VRADKRPKLGHLFNELPHFTCRRFAVIRAGLHGIGLFDQHVGVLLGGVLVGFARVQALSTSLLKRPAAVAIALAAAVVSLSFIVIHSAHRGSIRGNVVP
jgi:hypothetical protein